MTIRLGGILFGLGLTAVLLLWSLAPGVKALVTEGFPAKPDYYAFQEPNITPAGGFSFDGPMGTWDEQQLQRGYQVYKEVCSSCHSLKYVAFRDLAQLAYSDDEVRAEAATWTVADIDRSFAGAKTCSRPRLRRPCSNITRLPNWRWRGCRMKNGARLSRPSCALPKARSGPRMTSSKPLCANVYRRKKPRRIGCGWRSFR